MSRLCGRILRLLLVGLLCGCANVVFVDNVSELIAEGRPVLALAGLTAWAVVNVFFVSAAIEMWNS